MNAGRRLGALAILAALLLSGCALSPREAATRIDRLVDTAYAEWRLWGSQQVRRDDDGRLCALFDDGRCSPIDDGCGREMASRYCPLVNRYWPLVSAYRHPCDATDRCVDRRDPTTDPVRTEPWSAAFISFLYRQAGFSRYGFTFSDTHADYVSATRDGRMPDFELLRVPLAPRRGDLLCSARGPDRDLSPAQIVLIAGKASGPWFTRMHCDLVVEVAARDRSARLIGGNVAQSVSMREIALDQQGRVDWAPPPASGWLLVLRLRQPTWRTAPPDPRRP